MRSIAYQDERSVGSSFTVDKAVKESLLSTKCDPSQPRRVRFVDTVAVAEFKKYPISMHELIWYTQDDYDMIKARNSFILSMVKQGTFKESDKHSFRGLEYKLREGYKQRKWNKITSILAVLDEQEQQLSQNTRNPEAIADVYRDAAESAKESARINGEKDSFIDHSPTDTATEFPRCKSIPEDTSVSIRAVQNVSAFDRIRNRNVA
jgi:hypothetical protein